MSREVVDVARATFSRLCSDGGYHLPVTLTKGCAKKSRRSFDRRDDVRLI